MVWDYFWKSSKTFRTFSEMLLPRLTKMQSTCPEQHSWEEYSEENFMHFCLFSEFGQINFVAEQIWRKSLVRIVKAALYVSMKKFWAENFLEDFRFFESFWTLSTKVLKFCGIFPGGLYETNFCMSRKTIWRRTINFWKNTKVLCPILSRG